MRFVVKSLINVYNLMRQLGYHPHETGKGKAGESSFVRRIGSNNYPRFHIYVRVIPRHGLLEHGSGQEIGINIHLDQKKPIYKGVRAHSGEYGGELVAKEAERIKKTLGGGP